MESQKSSCQSSVTAESTLRTGCIVTGGDGKVKMIADKNLIVDLDKIDS
jgi:hypothetical protein